MKYLHDFKLIEKKDSYRIYKSNKNNVRLDFFSHVLRVAIYKDDARIFPTYTICPGESKMGYLGRNKLSTEGFDLISPKVTSNNNIDSFKIDNIDISIDLHNFRMFYKKNGKELFSDREYISYNFENELGNGSYHFITREKDEYIFGLGDKSGNVNKNKNKYLMATSDAMGYDARSSDPLYKQLPFYICKNSTGSYGIYYDTYSNGAFDFGKEINNYYAPFKSFRCEEDVLVFYIIFGEVEEIVHRFSYMCGKNLFPPKWSLKYCGSTMSYTDAPDADVQLRKFVDLCNKYDIDCGGFYLSSGYTQNEEKRYVFNWNKDKFPSPEDTSAYFKKNGIEFLPNIKPAFLTDHFLYEQIAKKGWFLHYKDGTPAIFPFWSGYGSYLDFTNKDAYDFWTQCVKEKLVDLGYKNIWNDNNEYDITDTEVYANGFGTPIQAKLIKPLFPLLMTMASLEAQDQTIRTMSVTRSGPGGLQRIAETWTGDNNTSFEEFRYNHKIAMTMSLSGFFNFGQDIGGFAGPCPNKELFLRWIQYGVFTPRFTLHSWNPDGSSTMPWLYEDEMETVKKVFNLRKKFMPYLYNNLYRSVETYMPIIYPIFLKYKDYDVESDCFFFGDDIIACPQFDEGKDTISVALPENNGGWYNNDNYYEGNVTMNTPLRDIPVFFTKGGSVIPFEEKDGLVFNIYPLEKGNYSYQYFDDDGVSIVTNKNSTITKFEVTCDDVIKVIVYSKTKFNIKLVDKLNRKLIVEYK